MAAAKRIIILGATGSVGRSALNVIAQHPDKFQVVGLSAGQQGEALAELARQFRPPAVAIADASQADILRQQLAGTDTEILTGAAGVGELAARPGDFVLSAIVGIAGLLPTMAALRAGRLVGLANKESLVCAGTLMTDAARQHGATIIPVDSEHSALFQLWQESQRGLVESVTLTASGGPFRLWSPEQMQNITVADALKHPNWAMGAKLTIDSATLVNKALEVMEAQVLFDLPPAKIKVLVHPESIVHGMISFVDGSTLAQLGVPDMRTPIAGALAWPARIGAGVAALELAQVGRLTFELPDTTRFPALRLAYEVMAAGGSAPVVFNAVNEVAVAAFLTGGIRFHDITSIIDRAMAHFPIEKIAGMEDILGHDDRARRWAAQYITALR